MVEKCKLSEVVNFCSRFARKLHHPMNCLLHGDKKRDLGFGTFKLSSMLFLSTGKTSFGILGCKRASQLRACEKLQQPHNGGASTRPVFMYNLAEY